MSLAGRRALVSMKHVGLNVAADPLFTLAYTGVNGGLVILVAGLVGDTERVTGYWAAARVDDEPAFELPVSPARQAAAAREGLLRRR